MSVQITYDRDAKTVLSYWLLRLEGARIAWEKVAFGKSFFPPAFRVTLGRDGYWQWCATPPGGDSVYCGFETAEAALKDAEATLSAHDASTS